MAKSCSNTSCSKESCAGCQHAAQDFHENPHQLSQIKKVIGVVSGKGGVGKSLVTSLLAVAMNKLGYRTAVMDADVTGPSIPKAFGLTEKATGDETGLYPVATKSGIEVMSVNLLLENETDPVVWRGPVIGGTVKQFWTDVIWTDIDYMFIDMPPGTGDVPLTVFQTIAVDGIVVVTSPQELVSMIVEKAVKMAQMMHIPILGLVENLSYFTCPDNGRQYKVFGDSHIDEISKRHNLPILARLPIDPAIAAACDAGQIETLDAPWMADAAQKLSELK